MVDEPPYALPGNEATIGEYYDILGWSEGGTVADDAVDTVDAVASTADGRVRTACASFSDESVNETIPSGIGFGMRNVKGRFQPTGLDYRSDGIDSNSEGVHSPSRVASR